MDRRQIELQITIIRVTYRGEARRDSSATMSDFRQRARELLADVAPAAAVHPDLVGAIAELRREMGLDAEDG